MTRSSLHWIWIAALPLGLAGACGDSGTDGPDAGGPPDDAPTAVDGPAELGDASDVPDAAEADAGDLPEHPVLVEVYYDHLGGGSNGDDQKEWIKLFNPTGQTIDLSGYALGWGGSDYTYGTLQLSGVLAADECFVVGGPDTDAGNGSPTYHLTVDLDPDLQNGGDQADGIALFASPSDQIAPTSVPVDVVLYGSDNNSGGLLDASGEAGQVNLVGVDPGQSMRRLENGTWEENLTATPNVCPPFPSASI